MAKIVILAILAIIISGQMINIYWGSWYLSRAHMETSHLCKTRLDLDYFRPSNENYFFVKLVQYNYSVFLEEKVNQMKTTL